MQNNPGCSDAWITVVGVLDEAIKSIVQAANLLDTVAGGELLVLEAKRLEAEISLFSIQVRRARAGLN